MKKAFIISSVLLACLAAVLIISSAVRHGGDEKVTEEITKEIIPVESMTVPENTALLPTEYDAENLSVEYETLTKEHSRDGVQLILNYLQYPVFTGSLADGKINEDILEKGRKLIEITSSDIVVAMEKRDYSDHFEAVQRNCVPTVFQKGLCISVRFTVTDISDGAVDGERTVSFNYNAETGGEMPLCEFLGWDPDFTDEYVKNVFSLLISSERDKYYDDAYEIISLSRLKNSYYITEEGIVLYHDSGFISPSVYGMTEVFIEYGKLK